MVINYSLQEHINDVQALVARGAFQHYPILLRIGPTQWERIMIGVVNDCVSQLAGWEHRNRNIQGMQDARLADCIVQALTTYEHIASHDISEIVDFVICTVLDEASLEIQDFLRPYVKRRSIWDIRTIRPGTISLTHVGDGAMIEKAMRASGGNFNAFLQQFI